MAGRPLRAQMEAVPTNPNACALTEPISHVVNKRLYKIQNWS